MALSNIEELSCDEVVAKSPAKFFRPAYAESPALPAVYDGKYVLDVVVVTDVAPDDAQIGSLIDAIEAVTGVYKAFALIGPARIPVDRTPADHDLFVGVQVGFNIRPVEEV